MSSRRIADLVAAVTDGEDVDWRTARARLTRPGDQAVVEQLEILSWLTRSDRLSQSEILAGGRPRGTMLSVLIATSAIYAAAALGAYLFGIGHDFSRTRTLALGLVAFGAAAIVLSQGSKYDSRSAALAGAYWAGAASFANVGVSALIPLAGWPSVLEGVALGLRPEVAMPACLWKFAQHFPARTRFDRIDRLCAAGFAGAAAIGIALFVANIAAASLSTVPPLAAALSRTHDQGRWFWLAMFGTVLPALVTIALRTRGAAPAERRRTRLFLLSIALGMTPLTLEVLAEALFPSFRAVVERPAVMSGLAFVIYPPLLLAPMASAYALLVHDVFSLRAAALRSVRQLLSRRLAGLLLTVSAGLFGMRLYGMRDVPLAMVMGDELVRAFAVALAAAAAFAAGRRRLIRLIDRRAPAGDDAAPAFLALVSERLRNTRTPLEIAQEIARSAAKSMGTSAHTLLGETVETWQGNGSALEGLPKGSLMPILLSGSTGPARVGRDMSETHYWLVSDADRIWIDRHSVALMCPLFAARQGSRPFAVIALEQRPDGRPFTATDERLLSAAAAAGSLAFQMLGTADEPAPAAAEEFARECSRCGLVAREGSGTECGCGAVLLRSPLPPMIGSRYTLLRKLGSGAMGVVYAARDERIGRDVALKTLSRLSPDAAGRLMHEARTLASVAQPHVAVLYDLTEWQGTPVLAMEWLDGGTLQTALAERGRLPPSEALPLFASLASALEVIHAGGLYHGDIKPSNIGFGRAGMAKFLDFGLSRRLDADHASGFGGTPAYLSPDVLAGSHPGPELDLWALAVVALETLVGAHPFTDGSATVARIAKGLTATQLREMRGLSEAERTFFAAALSGRASDRPATARELASAFERLAVPYGR